MPHVNFAKQRKEKTNSTANKEAKAKRHAEGATNHIFRQAQKQKDGVRANTEARGWDEYIGPANAPSRPGIDGRRRA